MNEADVKNMFFVAELVISSHTVPLVPWVGKMAIFSYKETSGKQPWGYSRIKTTVIARKGWHIEDNIDRPNWGISLL